MTVLSGRGARRAKAVFDRLVGVTGLAASAPVLIPAAIAVRLQLGKPVFFVQERPGYKGRPFRLVKLRTMHDSKDRNGRLLPDERRIPRLGRFLRAASIDELPQFWNVAKGELSLVGPRPLLMQYLERYSPEQARRHDVMPGITGWTAVNGRNALSWAEKFALDLWYVDNWSLWLDMKIIGLSLVKVVARSDIANEGHATMPEFMGQAKDAP